MERVYLANGQECILHEEIGNKYLVTKVFEYQDSEYGWIECEEDNKVVVDNIFRTKPIEKIESEIKEMSAQRDIIKGEIGQLSTEKNGLLREIEKTTKTIIDGRKFIINRTELINAKKVVFFEKDRIAPLTREGQTVRGMEIHLQIKISNGEERAWGYRIYDSYKDSGKYLCEKYGVMIDPSEEEVEAMIHRRVSELKFSDWAIDITPDDYLTKEMLEGKRKRVAENEKIEIEKLEKQIKDSQERLEKLKA